MTQNAVNNVERRFEDLRQTVEPLQWNDPVFLLEMAEKIRDDDAALALRVLQRVRNLRPDDTELMETLEKFSKELKQQQFESMRASSAENVSQV